MSSSRSFKFMQTGLFTQTKAVQTPRALSKLSFRGNQADHQEAVAGEIEKMPRMHEDIASFEEPDRQILIRRGDGYAQHRIPASLAGQAIDGAFPQQRIEKTQIRAEPLPHL